LSSLPPPPFPPDTSGQSATAETSLLQAMRRGFRGRCPVCGEGRLFSRFLKVVPTCACCAAPLGTLRADDAPPYFTILLVGHIVIPAMLILEQLAAPPLWVHLILWIPLTLLLALGLLQPIKGVVIGVLWRLDAGEGESIS
jgi:uncharacterized protein (DUF983 family)